MLIETESHLEEKGQDQGGPPGCPGESGGAASKSIANESTWRDLARILDPYLGIVEISLLRQTCRYLYRRKYRPEEGLVTLEEVRGQAVSFEGLANAINKGLSATTRQSLKLNLDAVYCLRDSGISRFLSTAKVHLREISLSNCQSITNEAIKSIFSVPQEDLVRVSLNNIRNRELDGEVFKECGETIRKMPRFKRLEISCTDITLDAVLSIYGFLAERSVEGSGGAGLQDFVCDFYGSLASRQFLEKLGFESCVTNFEEALGKDDATALISGTTKAIQKKMHCYKDDVGPENFQEPVGLYFLWEQYRDHGSELIANMPIQTNEEYGRIWTLPINWAIMSNKKELLDLLIRRGAQINSWDHRCRTPLVEACDSNNTSMACELLKYSADPSFVDFTSPPCLELAIKHNNYELCSLLVQHGALLNCKASAVRGYKSPLYLACETASADVISLLLNHGADPNWRGPNKLTPTALAYQRDSTWIGQFLNAGAGTPADRRWVLTEVLSHAIMKNDINAAKLLITKYQMLLKRIHQTWSMPHIQAARLGRVDMSKLFLDAGADINASGIDGQTALHVAAEEGHVKTVKLLLSYNADIEVKNKDGQTPLHIACLENRLEVAKLLLQAGASISVADELYGETPLMICIRTRHKDMAKMLIENAKLVDCDAADSQGRTALMYALFFGFFSVADMLVQKGADVTIMDDSGNSPYSIACERILLPGSEKKCLRKYLKFRKTQVGESSTNSEKKKPRAKKGSAVSFDSTMNRRTHATPSEKESSASVIDQKRTTTSGFQSPGHGLV